MAHMHIRPDGSVFNYTQKTPLLSDYSEYGVQRILTKCLETNGFKVTRIEKVELKKVWNVDVKNEVTNISYSFRFFIASVRDAADSAIDPDISEFKYSINTKRALYASGRMSIQMGIYIVPENDQYLLVVHPMHNYRWDANSNRRGIYVNGLSQAMINGAFSNDFCTIVRPDHFYNTIVE